MALNSLFCPSNRFIPTSAITSSRNIKPSSYNIRHNKREFPLPAAVANSSVPYQPINFDYLQKEFGGNGVTFERVGADSCVAKIELRNGSVATVLLPIGLITSYKTPMWHGGKVELLHTAVSEGERGGAVVQGGVSLNFGFRTDDDDDESGVSWSPSEWVLHEIEGDSEEYIQVKLVNKSVEDKIGLKYTVTLEEDALISELEVINSNSLPLQMTGSILSHLTVSTPDATYAIGLERSNYHRSPLFESEFVISPPDSEQAEEGFGKMWKLVPRWGADNDQAGEEDMNGEEMDGYKHLQDKISLTYTDAPRCFTMIDRGRRNSVSIGRNGFDEMYLFSPGSSNESYSKYSYILVGQAAVLKPIVIHPQDVWKGEQCIHNPNM